jgi:FMN phosphatase YigB (HAD superfamily)
MSISAVIFDAFGTLLKISEGTHPYRKILRLGIEQGRRPDSGDAVALLSIPMDLRQAANYFGIKVEPRFMSRLESELERELAGIEAFGDGIAAVKALQAAGLKIAVCSNLAQPYASAIERLYPSLDGYVYSFAVGAVKPSAEIYQQVLQSVSAISTDTWMIGDSKRCDCDGPAAYGIKGFYLDRDGNHGYTTLDLFADAILSAREKLT